MSFNIILSFNLGLPSYLFIHISGNRLHLVMPTNYEALLHVIISTFVLLPLRSELPTVQLYKFHIDVNIVER